MSRRMLTVVAATLLALSLGVIGATLPVPFVALGPGPTYDTLGDYEGAPIIDVADLPTYPTSGHLNMTTVSVTDKLSLFTALAFWLSPERRLVPREPIFPSDRTTQEVQDENAAQFTSSELNAVSAALHELGTPASVVVVGVVPDSPADGLLELQDQIVSVDGVPVTTAEAVTEQLGGSLPGQTASLVIRRAGEELTVPVVLGTRPDRPQGFLGITPGLGPLPDTDVTISLGGIGGPSAGLMFALGVVDKLTPGELTGGTFVAGTGSIGPSGAVSAIDGVPFKMIAAREVGATVFLVPAANCEEAVATAPDGLTLVRVDTLDDAVGSLDALRDGAPTPAC
ncbi:PDZ domain-containing protein [Pseudonocardia petroleophila]|uniref:endopeptidase La n=1 Tax=Pseudonocardia petroleophila TaxID=37331 RepID=A0A7G7MJS2_9PSEU|nr:PDZ domain-containing protein [Pseudonocardia petroleophila]QNG53033.1 PDZ domain-containing protein [Pseudonocardia petroleophila]